MSGGKAKLCRTNGGAIFGRGPPVRALLGKLTDKVGVLVFYCWQLS